MRPSVVITAVLTLLAASSPTLAGSVDPAQAIAQKFFEADQPPTPPARPKPKAPRAAKAAPAAPGADYEMDMLRRAQAEDAERRKEIAAPAPLAVEQPAPAALPQPIAEPPPTPLVELEPVAPPDVAAQPLMTRPHQLAEAQSAPADAPATTAAPIPGTRATILLILDPDDTEQAHVKSDPIICFDQECWISNGLDSPAKAMPRTQAVALKTTETPTGDSCSGKSGCAFRNVAFDPDSQIQVVQVGESRGVADGAYTVAADTTCRKLGDNLMCDNALVTHAFRMWVIPETTAQKVGASMLEDAVVDGLQDSNADNASEGK